MDEKLNDAANSQSHNELTSATHENDSDEEEGSVDDDTSEPEYNGSCTSGMVGCLKVAAFLSLVMRARAQIIRVLKRPQDKSVPIFH